MKTVNIDGINYFTINDLFDDIIDPNTLSQNIVKQKDNNVLNSSRTNSGTSKLNKNFNVFKSIGIFLIIYGLFFIKSYP